MRRARIPLPPQSGGNSLSAGQSVGRPLSVLCVNRDVWLVRWRLVNTRRQHKPWQPHFGENICLEVLSFLIFNVSPGAPRQHMFPACPEDTAASVSLYASQSHKRIITQLLSSSKLLLPPPHTPTLSTPALKQMAANYNGSCALKVQVTNSQQQHPPSVK